MHNTTINTPPSTGLNADKLFAVVGGGVLVLVGLVILAHVCVIVWLPGRLYEAVATVALYPNAPGDAQDGLLAVWDIVPPVAPVGLELIQGQPHIYRLSSRCPDPAQAAKDANTAAAAMQANAEHAHAGRFQILHPADVPVEWTSPRNRQFWKSAPLLMLGLFPVCLGLRMFFRRRTAPLDALPTPS